MQPIFFKPIPRSAIWGGTTLKECFGYMDFPDDTGQAWVFSGQEAASTVVKEGEYAGVTLRELWVNQPQLFQSRYSEFPFIISLVAPEDNLSIQVHPDKEYAVSLGFPTGKNEAWYFIHAEEASAIIYGHNARDKGELLRLIGEDAWEALIRKRPVHRGDFIYIPAGLLHALGRGSIVYEVQQATDITYRFYDYKRRDAAGNQRELHLEQAVECIEYYGEYVQADKAAVVENGDSLVITTYIRNDSFCIRKLEIKGEGIFYTKDYALATVTAGEGKIEQYSIKSGDSFLLPADSGKICFSGQMDIMLTLE